MRLLTFTIISGAAFAAAVPVPKVTPLPSTATSYPLGASAKTLAAIDLSKSGFVEEEFVLTGAANVYEWADSAARVRTSGAPYGTRILVRRPAASSKFNGSVVVEISTGARRLDWPMAWGYLGTHIVETNSAWVGVTMPGTAAGLKKFNPERYKAVSFADPAPGQSCPGAGKNGPSDQEEGLRWDMLSQVAMALKSDKQILGGQAARYVYLTSGLQGGDVVTYINGFHSAATLENGKPVYDGYLIKNAGGAGRLNQCSTNLAANDPRRTIANVNVPVINVVAEGEVIASLAMRKPDSDDPAGRFRQYEIAGAAHIDRDAFFALPSLADQTAAIGNAQGTAEWPLNAVCEPAIPLITHPLMRYAMDGALASLDRWVREGVPAPKAPPIEVAAGNTALVTTELGAKGGVRNGYVDVPNEAYATGSPGPGTCRELGHVTPFDAAKITSMYGDAAKYKSQASKAVDRSVSDRFFTKADGARMKAEIK